MSFYFILERWYYAKKWGRVHINWRDYQGYMRHKAFIKLEIKIGPNKAPSWPWKLIHSD